MYSPLIVERKLHAIRTNPKSPYPNLQFRSIDESLTITQRLTTKLYSPAPECKRLESVLDPKEMDWIRQEILLCRLSFNYCAARYLYAEIEGGGHAPAKWWQSQLRALELISKREESNHADYARYQFSEGIRIVWHKTRQQGATALARLMALHRAVLYKTTRNITASLDEDKVNELYKRDKIVWDNLPFFLRPDGIHTLQDKPSNLEYDTKAQAWKLASPISSTMLYQMANQQAGVGTGQQFDFSHFTETALWPLAERIQFDFLPAVPQLLNTFVGFESTANGRSGWWYEFTEAIRNQEQGFERWIYAFTPWYINSHKNRLIPPEGWQPSDKTKEHAELIERTSLEFAGQTIRPRRENLYWWESEYELNRKLGTLNIFFSNYPATPEQSFQHAASSAYPIEVIDWMRSTTQLGMPYNLDVKDTGMTGFQ